MESAEGRKSEKPVVLHSRHRRFPPGISCWLDLPVMDMTKQKTNALIKAPNSSSDAKDTYRRAARFWMQTVLGKWTYLEQTTLSSLAKMLIKQLNA